MSGMKIAIPAFVFIFTGAVALRAQQAGMSNEWDVRKTLTAIAAHGERLVPFLEQIQPQSWIAGGAPGAYVAQAKSSRNELAAIIASAQSLSRTPEKLSDELELLFRIRALETRLASLGEG